MPTSMVDDGLEQNFELVGWVGWVGRSGRVGLAPIDVLSFGEKAGRWGGGDKPPPRYASQSQIPPGRGVQAELDLFLVPKRHPGFPTGFGAGGA